MREYRLGARFVDALERKSRSVTIAGHGRRARSAVRYGNGCMGSALGPYAMEERATAYEKACATVLLQSMCYKYRKDENNAKLYLDKAKQFFEDYAEARATVLFNKEKGQALEYYSAKYGPLVRKGKMPSDDEIRAPIDRVINAEREQLEALSG